MINRIPWDEYFILQAKIAALRSGCNSRPNGAVIVKDKRILATGYNGPLPGKQHCTDYGDGWCYRRTHGFSDMDKYNYCPSNHAEANAIGQAARFGISIDGCSLYTTLAPCYICAKLIGGSGIQKVYFEYDYESADLKRDEHWASIRNHFVLWQQVSLSIETISMALKGVKNITALRRLEATS